MIPANNYIVETGEWRIYIYTSTLFLFITFVSRSNNDTFYDTNQRSKDFETLS